MGLPNSSDWTGQWINDGRSSPVKDEEFYYDDPAPLFRKEFRAKHVRRARLYISGLGYYEASLNGERVGDHVLDPGWTKFGNRVEYASYDVTRQIHEGENCLGVTLGNGWYNPLPMKLFGNIDLRARLDIGRPRFIAQLALEYADGTKETVISDPSWKVGTGAIRFDNVYLGERVDARLEPVGWNRPGFDDSQWAKPGLATEPIGKLIAQSQPPIRVTAEIPAVRVTQPQPGVFIYDFGQEFAGWTRLRLNVPAGTKLETRYGELLGADGSLNPMTSVAGQIKSPRKDAQGRETSVGGPGAPIVAWQGDSYIARGGGETYEQKFTFHGFRFLEIRGLSEPLPLKDVTGLRLNSDVRSVGSFSCSNQMFNQIQEMVRRTFLSNIFSVQSDCPHRERFGYGGDMVGTTEAFMLNFDMATFYGKTVQDFADAAQAEGVFPDTAPFIGLQYCGVGWAMAHPLLATQLAEYYGDVETRREQYDAAKRWLGAIDRKYPDGIVKDGLSDHESLEPTPAPAMVTPLYYKSVRLLQRMASDLGRESDAREFAILADKIRDAYSAGFIDPSTGKVGPGTQASQSFGLELGLVPPETKDKALETLLDQIRGKGKGHLTTGLMGTKFMLDTLSREGHAEEAYGIANQKEFPGWGWMLQNGATTLWEHWEKEEYIFSHCHPMFGSVSQWFISWLGGIQQAPDSVGFQKLRIRPQFVRDLDWVKASYDSMYGPIRSEWRRSNGSVFFDLEIPFGAEAEVDVPGTAAVQESGKPVTGSAEAGGQKFRIGSGRYRFSWKE
jgi:alpha-L-rhamnosidase